MRYVLFVCTHNADRSQMAQAFFERYSPADVRAESAREDPAEEIWPPVVEAMAEAGIDLSERRPERLTSRCSFTPTSRSPSAARGAVPACRPRSRTGTPDPAGLPVERVRPIRDEVERRVGDLATNRIEEIRGARGAHEARLARLLPSLVDEFEGVRTPGAIRACADAILDDYDDVPFRTMVTTLATRHARECLAAESCEALAPA